MASTYPIRRRDLRIRDPFILVHEGRYVMYAQAQNRAGSAYQGVEAYVSEDLEHWSSPTTVLQVTDPRVTKVWAPEMHAWDGAWHLLVTLTFPDLLSTAKPQQVGDTPWGELCTRGTWHYRADTPLGPFRAEQGVLLTPPRDMALDGTLYHDGSGIWLVYCHEWVQLVDGVMAARRLDHHLRPTGEAPITLFRASDAPCAPRGDAAGKITDGPFLFRCDAGAALFMLWSTNDGDGRYVLLAAESPSGSLAGPWTRQHILLRSDGGHGMVFTDLSGRRLVAVHQPNTGPAERLRLLSLDASGAVPRIVDDV